MELELSYTNLKSTIAAKGLSWQHLEDADKYFIYSVDHTITFYTFVWKWF